MPLGLSRIRHIARLALSGATRRAGSSGPPPNLNGYMLREDGSYLLREDGSRFIREVP